jgi:outer membrane cobalamin receptor
VTITRERTQRRLSSPHTSLVRLQPEAIEKMPVLLGEPDLIKILQMLPGVQRGHEGFSGMHVRGGNNDQNLILLDGMPVYNVNHLFGMFSVFNPATIKHVKLYKGAFPARYQGRVSSVVDVRMKEGNMKEFRSEGSIGIVSSKLSLEGPIKKDTSSFIISGRRTYIDILARPFIKKSLGGGVAGYYFYDLSGKVNYRFSEKSRLYLSSYLGKDRFYKKEDDEYRSDGALHEIKSKDRFQWGNVTGLLRWNYRFSDRLFANTSLSYSNFRFLTGQERKEMVNDSTQSYNYSYRSGLKNYTASMEFDYMPGP